MSTPKNQRLNQERTWPEQSSTTNNLFAPSVGHLGSGKWKVTMKTGLIGGSFWLQFGEHRNGHTLKCAVLCCFWLGQRFLFIGI